MRKPRELKDCVSYHVVARTNRKELIFNPDDVKEVLMVVLRRAKKKYHFVIKNFCIMGNHVHLIIKPQKRQSLSKIMQWILSVFAVLYNKMHDFNGHVWYDRFKSKIIQSLRQYLATFIYISRNPVKAGISKNATDYPFNGISRICKGEIDIMERPPGVLLKAMWRKIVE